MNERPCLEHIITGRLTVSESMTASIPSLFVQGLRSGTLPHALCAGFGMACHVRATVGFCRGWCRVILGPLERARS